MANPNPTPFKKTGAAANPKGRPPKGYSITEWFKQMFSSKPEIKDALGKSIIKKALEGDVAAQKMVWNYMDGMPVQKMPGQLTQVNVMLAKMGEEDSKFINESYG
jgi:hypothetical protein